MLTYYNIVGWSLLGSVIAVQYWLYMPIESGINIFTSLFYLQCGTNWPILCWRAVKHQTNKKNKTKIFNVYCKCMFRERSINKEFWQLTILFWWNSNSGEIKNLDNTFDDRRHRPHVNIMYTNLGITNKSAVDNINIPSDLNP